MIFNAYQTFAEFNKTGIDSMFVYVATISPIFTPMVLFGFFLIAMMGSYFSARRMGGGMGGDFPASFAVAGFLTFLVALVMTRIDGLINNYILIITLIVAILGILFVIFSRKD